MPVYDREYMTTRKSTLAPSSFMCYKGSNMNYVFRTGQQNLMYGMYVGGAIGLYQSTKNYKFLTVPKYAFGIGFAWAGFSMFTAMFRNSI